MLNRERPRPSADAAMASNMDWLNLHISVLDSPQVLRCDPVRRATWLFLLRYCISQENGGLIVDCANWGDTTWQQIVRVKLREVRAESPLWTWEGDNLRVTFYPSEKETEVQAKRSGGAYGGKAATEAKAQAARENGRRGGRQRTQGELRLSLGSVTQAHETQEPKLNPTEGNGKERNGKEVSAAAPPHAQEPPPEPGLFDPLPSKPPGEAPEVTRLLDPRTFADWRIMVGHRVFVGHDERPEWLALFAAEGWDEMSKGYAYLAGKHPEPAKLFLSMFQELR